MATTFNRPGRSTRAGTANFSGSPKPDRYCGAKPPWLPTFSPLTNSSRASSAASTNSSPGFPSADAGNSTQARYQKMPLPGAFFQTSGILTVFTGVSAVAEEAVAAGWARVGVVLARVATRSEVAISEDVISEFAGMAIGTAVGRVDIKKAPQEGTGTARTGWARGKGRGARRRRRDASHFGTKRA